MTDLTACPVGGAAPSGAASIQPLQYSHPELYTSALTYSAADKRWWKWTAPSDGSVRVDLGLTQAAESKPESLLNYNLRIYTGPDAASLSSAGGGSSSFVPSDYSLQVDAGVTYWFEASIQESNPRFWALIIRLNAFMPAGPWVQAPDRELIVDPLLGYADVTGYHQNTEATTGHSPAVTRSGDVSVLHSVWQYFIGEVEFDQNFGAGDPATAGYQGISIGYASHVNDAAGFHWTFSDNPDAPATSVPTAPAHDFGVTNLDENTGVRVGQYVEHTLHTGILLPISLLYQTFHGAQSISLNAHARDVGAMVSYSEDELLGFAGATGVVPLLWDYESRMPTPVGLRVRPDVATLLQDPTVDDPESTVDWSPIAASWMVGYARRYGGSSTVDYLGNIHGASAGSAQDFGPNVRPVPDLVNVGSWLIPGYHSGVATSTPHVMLTEQIEVTAGDNSNLATSFSILADVGGQDTWYDLTSYLQGALAIEASDLTAMGVDPLGTAVPPVPACGITLAAGDFLTYDQPPVPVPATDGTGRRLWTDSRLVCWLRIMFRPARFRLIYQPDLAPPPTPTITGVVGPDFARFIP